MATRATNHDAAPATPKGAPGDAVSLPLGAMALALGAGPIVLGGLIAAAAWSRFGAASLDALVASAVVCVVSLAAVGALRAMGPRPAAQTPTLVMFVSCSRLLMATVGALAIYLLREPSVMPYWIGFLASALVSLTAEALLAAGALRRTESWTRNVHATEDHA